MESDYRLQPIINIAEICARHGVRNAIISPGSRCAPLLIAFTSHTDIKCQSISDERSAGYIAMGIAQATQKTVVLVCTSGTAAANYLPAITEAFYQQIPLLVLTADRPEEWIDQQDGQAIKQQQLFGSFVKKRYQFPVSYEHQDAIWHSERMVNEAMLLAERHVKGPVHINIPIREPFYPQKDSEIRFGNPKIIQESITDLQLQKHDIEKLLSEIAQFKKILIVKGQDQHDEYLSELLNHFNVPVVTDIISNEHLLNEGIKHQDAFLGIDFKGKSDLKPDLLITFGKSVISKQLKLFLRKHKDLIHWHIQPYGEVADTFQSLQRIVRTSPFRFFMYCSEYLSNVSDSFLSKWQKINNLTASFIENYFTQDTFTEFGAIQSFLKEIPEDSVLHLANSMAIRYANFIGLDKDVSVYANRGTSGIDGCLSTAVGHNITNDDLHFVIIGDLAFFYDNNALWNNLPKDNLRILLINNGGGAIFGMIPGPNRSAAYKEFFVTDQNRQAQQIASMHGITYEQVKDKQEFEAVLPTFLDENHKNPMIIELISDEPTAVNTMQHFRSKLGAFLKKSALEQ